MSRSHHGRFQPGTVACGAASTEEIQRKYVTLQADEGHGFFKSKQISASRKSSSEKRIC